MNQNYPAYPVNLGSLQNPNSTTFSSPSGRVFVNNNPPLLHRLTHPGDNVTPDFEDALLYHSSKHNHSLNSFTAVKDNPRVIYTPHPNVDITNKPVKKLTDVYVPKEGVKNYPKVKMQASAAVLGFVKPDTVSLTSTSTPVICYPYASPTKAQVTSIYKLLLPSTMPKEFTTRIAAIQTTLAHLTLPDEVIYLATLQPLVEYNQFQSYVYFSGTTLNYYNVNPRNLKTGARGLYSRFDDFELSDYIFIHHNKGLRNLVSNTLRKLPSRSAYGEETFLQIGDFKTHIFNNKIRTDSPFFSTHYVFFLVHSVMYARQWIIPVLIANGYKFDFKNNVVQDPANRKLPVNLDIFDNKLYRPLEFYFYSTQRNYDYLLANAGRNLQNFGVTTLYFNAFRVTAQNPLSMSSASLKYARGLYKYILNHLK